MERFASLQKIKRNSVEKLQIDIIKSRFLCYEEEEEHQYKKEEAGKNQLFLTSFLSLFPEFYPLML